MYTRMCMHAHVHTCTHVGRVSARGRFVVRALVAGSSCARSWPVRRVCLVAGSSCVRSWPVRRVRARGRFVVCALVVRSLCV